METFEYEKELIKLTQDLVRLPSVNPCGNENLVTEYLINFFEKEGIEYWTMDVENDRKNVVAVLRGISDKEGLIFTGHQDVVPISDVEKTKWNRDPFSGDIEGGKIHGRGSSDMKGGVASAIMALVSLKRQGFVPKKDIILLLTCDEEHYMKGSRVAIENEYIKSAKYCIVCEPTEMKLCYASRGRTWAKIDVIGKTAHGSQQGVGINAIEKCSTLIEEIKKHDFKYSQNDLSGITFWQPYAISAGVEPAIVPDKCSIYVDARLTLGHNPDIIWEDMQNIFEKIKIGDKDFNAKIEVVEKRSPWVTSKDDKVVILANDALKRQGINPIFDIFMGTTDGSKLNSVGINPIIMGPGDLSCVHKENESLEIEQLIKACLVYRDIMVDYR